MRQMINTTNYAFDVERYRDEEDARRFAEKFGCDGFELLPCDGGNESFFTEKTVEGVHLHYLDEWVDLWHGRLDILEREYGSLTTAREIFGGLDRNCILARFEKDLERARELHASYVVFHVSDVKVSEVLTHTCAHTDEEVIDAAAELINLLLDQKNYKFDFLMENLWWPGLTLTKPKMTQRLLEQVHYPKKGIMLDTGHLMHTNLELASQEEAIDYILEKIEEHGELVNYMKGIHLNQSLTGDYVKEMLGQKMIIPGTYQERVQVCYEHIFHIDRHLPFTTPYVKKLVERIQPDYLTHELITYNREEHEQKMACQCRALW